MNIQFSDNRRILIICGVRVNDQSGGGVAMANFFRDFAGDRIAQIHTDVQHDYSFKVVQNYFMLPLSIIYNHTEPILEQIPDVEGLLSWVQAFNPDVIYYQPLRHVTYFNRLAIELALRLDVPIISHIMDNLHRLSLCADLQEWLDEELKILFHFSSACLAISDEMVIDYSDRYSQEFIKIQQFINAEEWRNIQKNYDVQNDPLIVAYIGKLIPGMQIEALTDVACALQNIHEEGIAAELHIYGPRNTTARYSDQLVRIPCVHYKGFLPDEAYRTALRDADLLVIVGNFDDKSIENIKYSMPAKTPHYMASGTAILIYSPPGLPQNNAALREGWAEVVQTPDIEALEQSLRSLLVSSELRKQYGTKGRQLAFEKYEANVIRKSLNRLIDSIVEQHHGYTPDLVEEIKFMMLNNVPIQDECDQAKAKSSNSIGIARPIIATQYSLGRRLIEKVANLRNYYMRWPGIVAIAVITLNIFATLDTPLAPLCALVSATLLLGLLGHIATKTQSM